MPSVVEQLKNHAPRRPDYSQVLSQFSRNAIADTIGCSSAYLCTILTGVRRPGPVLDKKLRQLAAKVELEQEGRA